MIILKQGQKDKYKLYSTKARLAKWWNTRDTAEKYCKQAELILEKLLKSSVTKKGFVQNFICG